STRTPVSLTLPKTRDVVVLAVDLTPATGGQQPAATPTFSPAPGSYSGAQSVTLADATVGASIYYTTNGSTPTTSSTLYKAGTPIPVSASETIEAIAVASGYAHSAVATGSYVIGTASATEVSLSSSANVDGIVNNGSAVPGTGMDGYRDAYSATLLGTSLSWNGNTYRFGAAGTADAVSNATIPLPSGSFSTLSLLGTAVDGIEPNQIFTVNYSDGTSVSFTQSLSDWFTPQNYPGESKVLTMPYRISPSGTLDNRTFHLYGYAFGLDSTKTPVSLTLPKTRDVVVLALDLR
ncbi:MAG: chitobiase/beta-hexosaminidase C-terminal domain-containing protein, partial [Gammaproteobacteria bacterium]|nr:chitobiase/beta-hexosaminidase C-terminal domain-containing protein [Gammaproteobacteria bacterium]